MSFLDVLPLSALGAATEQQDKCVSDLPAAHAIAGAVIDSELAHAAANAFPVTKQSSAQTVKAGHDSRSSLPVREPIQPKDE
jgi:hypothetical protein